MSAEPKYVKNAVVRDNYWEREGFYETRNEGFIAAVNIYETDSGSYALLFKDNGCCFLIDDDTGEPASREEIMKALVQLYQDGDIELSMEDAMPDNYCEIGVEGVVVDEDTLEEYGFSPDQINDITERMEDLANYYEITETDSM